MSISILFFIFISLLAFLLLGINLIFAYNISYKEKNSPFECGFHSFLGQNRTQFSISFFIYALLFLLFDLEILLIYPYAVSAYNNGIYGLIIMLIFFIILTIGFVFELGKKALIIESKQTVTLSNIYKIISHKNSSSYKFNDYFWIKLIFNINNNIINNIYRKRMNKYKYTALMFVVKRTTIIFVIALFVKALTSCFYFKILNIKFFMINCATFIPILGKYLAKFIDLGDIITKINITDLIINNQYFGFITIGGALFGSIGCILYKYYFTSTTMNCAVQPVEPNSMSKHKDYELPISKKILDPKGQHSSTQNNINISQVNQIVRVNGRIGKVKTWGVAFYKMSGLRGPTLIFDPANQTTNYDPKGNNQPLLCNTRKALDHEASLKHSSGMLSDKMFTNEQRKFIIDRLQDVNPDLARLTRRRGGLSNIINNRWFRSYFPIRGN